MRKILIVEDTQANLDAAKAFFSTISGFEFVYATNRKEAEEKIKEADAIITDRSMPFDGVPQYNQIAAEANGYLVAANAKKENKPVILLTEHGRLGIGTVNNSVSRFEEFAKLVEIYKGKEITETEASQIHTAKFGSGIFQISFDWEFVKLSQDCWALALHELQKQF